MEKVLLKTLFFADSNFHEFLIFELYSEFLFLQVQLNPFQMFS